MSKFFYRLEDHFDALAVQYRGRALGWLSKCLSGVFAFAGDVVQPVAARPHHH